MYKGEDEEIVLEESALKYMKISFMAVIQRLF